MSDFDKEAERERLREKYENDQAKRESTQRMSELLLQGATMTNKHCENCADPIFRYQGQEFCATCQGAEADPAGIEPRAETDAAGGNEADAARPEPGEPDARDSTQAPDGEPEADASVGDVRPNGVADAPSDRGGTPNGEPRAAAGAAGESANEDGRPERRATPAAKQSARTPAGAGPPEGGRSPGAGADVAEARAALVRTLTRLARAAEAAEDPRRAREHLTAAREAAEAIAALDR